MASFLNKIFPMKYDFYKLLEEQASAGSAVISALIDWLSDASEENEALIHQHADKADDNRRELEKNLVTAFSTPFDRGDIYYISITMEKSLEYARSTMVSMNAFGVETDSIIKGMAGKLRLGTMMFESAIKTLKNKPADAELFIPAIRETHADIEEEYRAGMCAVFTSGDPMEALRHREIYHHLKDSSKYLESSVDVLHRIIVRIT